MFCSTNEFRNNTPGSCDLEKIKFDCSNNLTLDCFRNKKVLLCAKQCNAFREDQKDLSNPGKPEPEQVLHIFNILGDDVRIKIFSVYLSTF